MVDKVYYSGTYPKDHWALQPIDTRNSHVIGIACYKKCQYAMLVNPTDKRGYRCLVRMVDNSNPSAALNRDYFPDENRGLSLIAELVERVLANIVPIVQIFKAGNNAHYFDSKQNVLYMGNEREPNVLHMHIIGRGDPNKPYIENVKLEGPYPGINFDMMGKTLNEPGNDAKLNWAPEDILKVRNHLKTLLEIYRTEYESYGVTIV